MVWFDLVLHFFCFMYYYIYTSTISIRLRRRILLLRLSSTTDRGWSMEPVQCSQLVPLHHHHCRRWGAVWAVRAERQCFPTLPQPPPYCLCRGAVLLLPCSPSSPSLHLLQRLRPTTLPLTGSSCALPQTTPYTSSTRLANATQWTWLSIRKIEKKKRKRNRRSTWGFSLRLGYRQM